MSDNNTEHTITIQYQLIRVFFPWNCETYMPLLLIVKLLYFATEQFSTLGDVSFGSIEFYHENQIVFVLNFIAKNPLILNTLEVVVML